MTRATSLTLLLAGSSFLAFPTLVSAQQAPASAAVSEVVVTGSRLIANGNTAPTPVTVVSTETLQNSKPTTLMDALNDLPVFSGSRSQTSNPISSGIAGAGSPASNQLNLRNLGANRTLVLFDGQRVAPTTIAGIVDADIIPQMLIQRVEVVTGGTSAVYGSDAIVGVVNFIKDNKNWKAGIAVGTSLLDGRAHIEASFEHYDDQGVLDRWSRDWNTKFATVGTGAQANPYVLLANVRNNSGSFGGLITSGVLAGQQFKSNGVLSPFVHGAATPTATAEVGGDGYFQSGSMVAPLTWDQTYVRGDFDVTNTIHAHLQVARNKKSNEQRVGWAALTNITISAQNAFLPAAYQQQLAAAKQATFVYGKILDQEPRLEAHITSDQVIANGGLNGSLGDWKWDVSGNYGKTQLKNNFLYNTNNDRLSAALDAVVNPANGQIVCNSTLTNPGLRPDCAPLNLFGPTSASQAALDYVFQTTHFAAQTKTTDFNASIAGSPFNTWAGPVNVAFAAEWRKTSYQSATDADATAAPVCSTGLRFNCNANTLLWRNAFGNRSEVSGTVKEASAEFEAPLLKDIPFVQSFGINGAVRYTSYSTSGDYWTWKVGGDWHINDQLRVRGTVSRDIRAPTLNDLYAPATIQATNTLDQLTNTTPAARSYRAGNPKLVSEIGETNTLGMVYQPEWLPRFSLAIDAFDIKVNNAIVEVAGNDSVIQQACYASGGAHPYCSLQDRPLGNYTNKTAANAVTAWYQYNINIAGVRSYGMDVEANYAGDVFDRHFSLRGFLTWQPHSVYSTPGLSDVDMGGTAYGPTPLIAQPSLRVNFTESLQVTDNFRIDLQQKHRNAMDLNGDSTLYVACCKVKPITYYEANFSYKTSLPIGDTEFFLNIQNILDTDPPPSSPPGSTTPGLMGGWAIGDDPLGRSFVVGFRLKR
jgi:iron complex outermembrane receptor protein